MDTPKRFPAFIAYLLPVVGWLYVILFERKNPFAMFHARQALGLLLFLAAVFGGWAVAGYILALIPYVAVLSVVLFTLVIVAYIAGFVIWIIGMANALQGKVALLPLFGRIANGLPG